jgi:hypothetical protein
MVYFNQTHGMGQIRNNTKLHILNKDELGLLGFEIYNELVDRHIVVKTMWCKKAKFIMKIPRNIPIWDGLLFIEFDNISSQLLIKHGSLFGVFFGETLLEQIKCSEFSDLHELVNTICDKIVLFHRS